MTRTGRPPSPLACSQPPLPRTSRKRAISNSGLEGAVGLRGRRRGGTSTCHVPKRGKSNFSHPPLATMHPSSCNAFKMCVRMSGWSNVCERVEGAGQGRDSEANGCNEDRRKGQTSIKQAHRSPVRRPAEKPRRRYVAIGRRVRRHVSSAIDSRTERQGATVGRRFDHRTGARRETHARRLQEEG